MASPEQQVLDELGVAGLLKAAKKRGVSVGQYVEQETAQRSGLATSMLRLPQLAIELATSDIERQRMASESSPTDIVADLLPTIFGGGAQQQGEVIAIPVPPEQSGGGGLNLTAILVLAALGFGAWWLWKRYKKGQAS